MKNIVKVQRADNGRIRMYEIPAGMNLAANTRVSVETNDGRTAPGTVTDQMQIDDNALAFFLTSPILKVTAIFTDTPIAWAEEEEEEEEEKTEE